MSAPKTVTVWHANAFTGTVYIIVAAPEGWARLDAERDGLILVDKAKFPGQLLPFNLYCPNIAQHFPTLEAWLTPELTS